MVLIALVDAVEFEGAVDVALFVGVASPVS
jgi:hypothetical protein